MTQELARTEWFKLPSGEYELRVFGGEDAGEFMPEIQEGQQVAREAAEKAAAPLRMLMDSKCNLERSRLLDALRFAGYHLKDNIPALQQLHAEAQDVYDKRKATFSSRQRNAGRGAELNAWQEV